MGKFQRALIFVLPFFVLAASGCGGAARLPHEEGAAALEFHADSGRLSWIRTTVNRAGDPVAMTGGERIEAEGCTVFCRPDDARAAAVLGSWLARARKDFARLGFMELPRLSLDVRPGSGLPAYWRGSLRGGMLTAPLFYTSGALVRRAGSWKRLDDAAAAQLLGLFHEMLERAMLFGGGPRLDDPALRWMREGLATFLPAREIDSAFVCDPCRGSKLESKYYYATAWGSRLLKWNERRGVSWNAAYAASLGFMYAAYTATSGRFPAFFLAGLTEGREPKALLAEVLGCSPRRFADSIRRPIPELMPASKGSALAAPEGFHSDDAPGLRPGDVIIAVDGRRVTVPRELDEALWRAGAKREFLVTVRRGGAVLDVPCLPILPRFVSERKRP